MPRYVPLREAGTAGASGSIRLEGGKELDQELRGLERKVARKILSQSLREGAKVVLAEAKRRAPVRSGLVRSKLRVRSARKRKSETVALKVQTGEGNYKGKTFYASFLEFGFNQSPILRMPNGRIVSMKRSVRNRLRLKGTPIAPRPFMGPAFHAKAREAVRVTADTLWTKIKQAIA
jgi:HK97 gp10 family phage protein